MNRPSRIPAKMSIEEYQGFMETGALPEAAEVLGAMAMGTSGRLPAAPAQQLLGGGSEARIQGGRDAQAGGKQFEADLELTHQVYLKTKMADICRLPVNTQPMPRSWIIDPKKHGGIARILSERQRADYFGISGPAMRTVDNDYTLGRCIQMEAKSQLEATKGLTILPKGKTGHGLTAHQIAGLVQAYEFGAMVAVVWRNGPNRLVFTGAVLEKAWREFRLGQIKRLEAAWATPYEYRREQGVMIHDWLRAAR